MLCFRLHFTKDATIGNTAGATVRQLVSLVFERVVIEDAAASEETSERTKSILENDEEDIKLCNSPSKSSKPFAADAFNLFQVFSFSLQQSKNELYLLSIFNLHAFCRI